MDSVKLQKVADLHPPNPSVVAHIEKLLGYAQAGTLRSIVEVVEWDDGSVGNGYVLSPYAQKVRLLGEVHVLSHRLATEIMK